ncbi:hypothetical protein CBR_g37248 [Chara braunii]|uniref:CCHC-type domain-containing protein n=1 Tax=Chara braunii TaxID=69332 RepID=A0A388LMS4_CHABU|nr:hypothetical protein CBR_g37248 [Chara braunii]|eukprot:GBG83533.1 hypothetical protein CBR_g37248 [Chara braunii]
MAVEEEMERKFAANFLEGEDYPRDGDSTELARARAELAALQNKFENMGFVSGLVTYMEQIGPKRVILSETPSISAPMIPPPVRALPPPPVEAPVRSNESAAIFELTKTLISLIQESKKEQREHSARLEAMMRNMRPIAVRAPPMQQGLAQAPALGGAANNLNVCYACHQPGHLARDYPHQPPQQRIGAAPMAAAPIANGPGRVGGLMEEIEGGGSALATLEEAAELIPLDQYILLGYPGLGMIGTIRPAPEPKEVAEWRPSLGEKESGGPTFVTGEINVLNIIRALDHRIPLPIGHLLSISEQANERMLQHCKANRKRFALARTPNAKAKNPAPEENPASTSDPIRWVRCPMGICNAPATFQRAMNMTFLNFVNKTRLTQGMINFCAIVYMDDILVYSETYHGHAQHIEWTLGALRDAGFKIALEKSKFFLSEISLSGYVVTHGGLRPDSRKVAAVKEAPVPMSLTQVRAFLELASYYRRFIKGFAAIARPLTNLLRKDQPLSWDAECQQAFATLKDTLATAPILIRSDPSKQFILITDWQPEAISAILAQKGNNGREHVIEFASRTFFCTAGVYGAAEFRFTSDPHVVVLAEATTFQRQAAPRISHVSTVVVFSDDITAFDPARQAAIKSTLYRMTNPRFFQQSTAFEWAALRAEEEAEEESEGELRKEAGEAAAGLAKDEEEEREAEEESAEAEEEEEEEAEEETSEEEEEAYSEYSEGEQSEEEDEDDEEVESGDDPEPTHDELEWVPGPDRREENPEAAAQRKKEIAEGKRLAIDPAPNNPFKDPEPPKPKHGDLATTISRAAKTRRRPRSRSTKAVQSRLSARVHKQVLMQAVNPILFASGTSPPVSSTRVERFGRRRGNPWLTCGAAGNVAEGPVVQEDSRIRREGNRHCKGGDSIRRSTWRRRRRSSGFHLAGEGHDIAARTCFRCGWSRKGGDVISSSDPPLIAGIGIRTNPSSRQLIGTRGGGRGRGGRRVRGEGERVGEGGLRGGEPEVEVGGRGKGGGGGGGGGNISTPAEMEDISVGFVGAGQMAEALARGFDRSGLVKFGKMFLSDVAQVQKYVNGDLLHFSTSMSRLGH